MDPREYFTDLHNAVEQPIQWIVKDVTPVGLQIIGGAPKSFKSTVTNAIPAIAAQWPCFLLPRWASLAEDMHGPSLILSGEATASELAWLYRQGFKCPTFPDQIYINDDPWDFKLDRKETLKALLDMLDIINPRICIIDPLKKFHSGDENDATFMEEILYPLRRWAVKNEAAIMVVHHARKAPSAPHADNDTLDPSQLRGSNAIYGAADSILMCECKDRSNGHVRVGAVHKRASGWTRDLMLGAPGIPGWSVKGHERLGDLDRNVERLFNAQCNVDQIAKQLRMKNEEVNEVLCKLERNK